MSLKSRQHFSSEGGAWFCASAPSWNSRSDPEAFPATAAITLVGVDELEAFVQSLTHKVKLGAVDISHAFRINQHLHPIVFKHHIFWCNLIGVFKFVSET